LALRNPYGERVLLYIHARRPIALEILKNLPANTT
jgi:hypothetical protein